jgi:hypothetical protein
VLLFYPLKLGLGKKLGLGGTPEGQGLVGLESGVSAVRVLANTNDLSSLVET